MKDASSAPVQSANAEAPEDDDHVVEEGDVHVFIDPEIVGELDDQTLEATTADERIRFALTQSGR